MEKMTNSGEIRSAIYDLLTIDAEKLSDTELLGMVIGSFSLGRILMGSYDNWYDINNSDLLKTSELADNQLAQLLALKELSKRFKTKPIKVEPIKVKPIKARQQISCSADIFNLYQSMMASKLQEEFWIIALNAKNKVMTECMISKGTATETLVCPSDVFRVLIMNGAVRTIAIHNHPSGDPEPSAHDITICQRLKKAGELIGIILLDFIIVARDGVVSFADRGLLEMVNQND